MVAYLFFHTKKSKIFNEDVEASSEKYFDDKKVSKNDLSRLMFKECCQNMRKTSGDPSKKGIALFSIVASPCYFLKE